MNLTTICFKSENFNIKDTLECGQVFRFRKFKDGYLVLSNDKACYCYEVENKTYIQCDQHDKDYFYNYFDLAKDYSKIVESAKSQRVEILSLSAKLGKGIRILKQDVTETLFSFIISQNNNIPRIKNSIEKICQNLGEKKEFMGEIYFSFPTNEKLAEKPLEFYKEMGLGYRAVYLKTLAQDLVDGKIVLSRLSSLPTKMLKNALTGIYGVGPKVADCVSLFGFNRTDSFPVDTWIAKVYEQDFGGKLKDRKKMAEWFSLKFGDNAGYFQQYLFYYKRSLESHSSRND